MKLVDIKGNITSNQRLILLLTMLVAIVVIFFGLRSINKKVEGIDYKNTDLNDVSLSDLKGKVLLIQFTGVGCGPCHHSIPFLKKLTEEYKAKDFEFVSIETWSNNIEGLKRYQQRNGLNFKFLKSTDDITKTYGITSVPTFLVIDENRIIRKIIKGYSKEVTDNEIKKSIDKYL